jgi:hypothetical protein
MHLHDLPIDLFAVLAVPAHLATLHFQGFIGSGLFDEDPL